ncbi:MAG: hypothetical protein HY529_02445 [Chloroflexi bacterium]|nr:hypothetical protein [Chloroflexota bacterium]
MTEQLLPPAQDLKSLIKAEHHHAELERLRAGYDGCGCADCQQLYETLDLGKYGKRVVKEAGIIIITAGRAGADLWAEYNKPDSWIKDDNLFVTGGQKFGVSKTGATVVTPVTPTPPLVAYSGCDTGRSRESVGVGGVTTDITAKITGLASQGKSSRAIEKELLADGVVMSYRTVARRLQGVML